MHRDQEALADEEIDLLDAEASRRYRPAVAPRLFDALEGEDDHEVESLVVVDLWALVALAGVLHRERMERELFRDELQLVFGRLGEIEPDQLVAGVQALPDLMRVFQLPEMPPSVLGEHTVRAAV